MIEQSIGVIYGIPIRKVTWHVKNPSIEAANILGRSFLSTFSAGRNDEIIQNNAPAPSALRVKMPSGDIRPSLVRSLHTIMLNPNIEYAIRHDRWPIILSFLNIILFFCLQI